MSDRTGNLPAKRDEEPPDRRLLLQKVLELETMRVAASNK